MAPTPIVTRYRILLKWTGTLGEEKIWPLGESTLSLWISSVILLKNCPSDNAILFCASKLLAYVKAKAALLITSNQTIAPTSAYYSLNLLHATHDCSQQLEFP